MVRLSKINTEQYRGQFNIDDYLLREKTLKWANNNLDIKVENFPERVACTGSMRPIIHCVDKVIYEPANPGDPLQFLKMKRPIPLRSFLTLNRQTMWCLTSRSPGMRGLYQQRL